MRRPSIKFDGLIITGAPIETLEFEQVDYWPELQIMDWLTTSSTMHVGVPRWAYHRATGSANVRWRRRSSAFSRTRSSIRAIAS